MTDVAALVRLYGGMAQKRQLVRRGVRDLDLTRAVRSGQVHRVRNGWYSTLDERSPEVRAVRVGGRLTGLSAVVAWGGWSLGRHPLHVSVHENGGRLRTQQNRFTRLDVEAPRGVALHWDADEVHERGTAVSVGLLDALERVVLDEEFETAVAALDWALHAGVLDRIDFETLMLRLPAERQAIAAWTDQGCESLPESLARTRLRLRGHAVRSQVPLMDGRRVDLLVDEIVGLEVDGEEFHCGTFFGDRDKEIQMTIEKIHCLRPTANHVFHDWDRVLLAVEEAIASRRNLASGNDISGNSRGDTRRSREPAGWRRRPPRRLPEFSKVARKGEGRDEGTESKTVGMVGAQHGQPQG